MTMHLNVSAYNWRWMILVVAACALAPGCTGVDTTEEDLGEGYILRCDTKRGKRERVCKRISPEGLTLEEIWYRDSTQHGPHRFYYPNGQIEIENHYADGTLQGVSRRFYPDGSLKSEVNYVNGAMQGTFRAYYPNGALREKVTMIANEEDGPFEEYFPNGQIKTRGEYRPGEDGPLEEGELIEYDSLGQPLRIADCRSGICITRTSAQKK